MGVRGAFREETRGVAPRPYRSPPAWPGAGPYQSPVVTAPYERLAHWIALLGGIFVILLVVLRDTLLCAVRGPLPVLPHHDLRACELRGLWTMHATLAYPTGR